MITIIDRRVFLQLVKTVYAAYNKESLGSLFGRRKDDSFIIDYSVSTQKTISRTPTRLYISANQANRLETVVEPLEELLGYYHSHCDHWNSRTIQRASLTPSTSDLTDFLVETCPLLLMLSVHKTSKNNPLCIRPDYISGTFRGNGTKFHVAMRTYYREGKRHHIVEIKLIF